MPQRRRRIALVADFGGQSAPEVLFERESVSGDTAESRTQREGASAGIKSGTGETEQTVICLQGNGIDRADTAGCNGKGWRYDKCYTLNTIDRHAVYDARGNGKIVPTLTGDHNSRVTDYTALIFRMRAFGDYCADEIASCLKARNAKDSADLVIDVNNANMVRRLTPMENERAQGYQDGWTDIGDWIDNKGKKRVTSDSARYKALGNSIALPPWRYVLSRLCKQICRTATMASLFDGIGGFPLIWEEINGSGSCLWASEIEEFPIAVTSRRFCNEP